MVRNQYKQRLTFMFYASALILGVISGFSDAMFIQDLGKFISDIFIRLFKCISLPMIALSIMVTLSHYKSDGLMRTVWRRTLVYTLTTTLIAATVSCLLYDLIAPTSVKMTAQITSLPTQSLTYREHLAHLFPENMLSPFLENQVLTVLLMSIVLGIGTRCIPDDTLRQSMIHCFRGLHALMMVITRWIIMIIPIGLYGFMVTTVTQCRAGSHLAGVGEYLAVIVLSNLVQGLIILPLWLRWHKIKPFQMMRGMLPALSLAFFSKSSVGTLPVTMDVIEKKLHVKPEVSRFVLPLCTSINMNGCAAFIFTTVIYLMQNNGVVLSWGMMFVWIIVATIAAIGNAGVPMGCFFLSASLLASMNVPMMLMGVILPFYSLIDMLETALNVWSDSCVARVIHQHMEEQHG